MVNTKEYILTRFGEYSGLNPEFIQSFDEWDGQGIQNFLDKFVTLSIRTWIEEKNLYDHEGNPFFNASDLDNLARSSSLLGVCFELSNFPLSEEILYHINFRSGFYCYDKNHFAVGFRDIVFWCSEFERITNNIAYRKAREWFSEIYWNPHYVWGKKFLENRIDKDEIFIEN